jgi:hypothetical protein
MGKFEALNVYFSNWLYSGRIVLFFPFNNRFFFSPQTESRKVKQVLSGGWYQWEGEDVRKG